MSTRSELQRKMNGLTTKRDALKKCKSSLSNLLDALSIRIDTTENIVHVNLINGDSAKELIKNCQRYTSYYQAELKRITEYNHSRVEEELASLNSQISSLRSDINTASEVA